MPDESEPPIREFADRGVLWLLESPQNLHDAVSLLSADIADRLDFSRAEKQNKTFVPDDLHKQEADLLYSVPFRSGNKALWLYVLLEHQSRPDRTMGFRVLSYMVQIWSAQVRGWEDANIPVSKWRLYPILPVVLYTGRRRWKTPISLASMMDVPSLLEVFVPKWDTLFLNLQETRPDLLSEADLPVTHAFRALQAMHAPVEDFANTIREVTAALDALPESEARSWHKVMLYLYLLVRHTRSSEEQSTLFGVMNRAVRQHQKELEETSMTGAQVLINQGRAEEREELVLELLQTKFGAMTKRTEDKVRSLSATRMKEITHLIFQANTLEDLGL